MNKINEMFADLLSTVVSITKENDMNIRYVELKEFSKLLRELKIAIGESDDQIY